MKKVLITGAASVALAALPVASSFAAIVGSPLTDTLTLNLEDLCTLSRGANAHTAGATTANLTASNWSNDTYTGTVTPNQSYDAIATSAFNVTCNNVTNYQVTVDTTPFTKTGDTAPLAAEWTYSDTGTYAGSGSSWYLSSNGTGADTNVADGGKVFSETTNPITSSDFTITYNVKVSQTQKKGTYTATAEYTLATAN